ncbi:hypothetical protein [Ottowia thiooxydans]|uniref:hypothetical protein n=1 Tax=Ottowia thiooxydans TaxID=219182 RepID=UPI0012EC3A48|nr:hypothetical protein [Ottowia thiooxydans]
MSTDLQQLTDRALSLYARKPDVQQPAAGLSGPATAGGFDYIVVRNLSGTLAV